MRPGNRCTRRRFLSRAAASGGGVWLAGVAVSCRPLQAPGRAAAAAPGAAEVTPAEDLMFEHGVIGRLLLVYEEAAARIEAKREVPPAALAATANLLRAFSEDYHERLEEREVFPRLEKAGEHLALIRTLKAQHEAGRTLTDLVLQLTASDTLREPKRLRLALVSYSRMFAPHLERESSVLFKTFQALLPAGEYGELGEQFEQREHELFGEDGFQNAVAQVAEIERQLGIYELDQFTARTA